MVTATPFPAPAKLNLFLHVVGRRADGYHLLQSVFALIELQDRLEIAVRNDGAIRRLRGNDGIRPEDDLMVRAAFLLQRESGCTLGADLSIDKRIPMGGGLGGGSSDAATVLLALNALWNLDWPVSRLKKLGLALGADVPFFVQGCNAWVEGIGETLVPVELPPWWYVVLEPPSPVSTAGIFASPELTRNSIPLKIADFSANGLGSCRNDLQPVVLKEFPQVSRALLALDAAARGSLFGARMTGSGGAVFAAFEQRRAAEETLQRLLPEYPGFVVKGLDRHPLHR